MIELKNVHWIRFPTFTDPRGSLSEVGKIMPFKIERTYHVYNAEINTQRGDHAHLKNEQVYACLNGKAIVILDDGINKKEIELSDPSQGLYVGPMIWSSIKYLESNTLFFVWNSRGYEPEDYIKEYNEFLKIAHENLLQ